MRKPVGPLKNSYVSRVRPVISQVQPRIRLSMTAAPRGHSYLHCPPSERRGQPPSQADPDRFPYTAVRPPHRRRQKPCPPSFTPSPPPTSNSSASTTRRPSATS